MQLNYKRTTYILAAVAAVLALSLLVTFSVLAGSTDSPSVPTDSASQMYTLQNIYDRLTSAGNATKMTTFTEPASGPGSTMYTLDEIYALAWPSRVPKTGQTAGYAANDDGALQRGVAWPNPRFTDNSDGTVTDNLTGLIWLEDANCFGTRDWATALTDASGLANESCSLTDGSVAGDWRLPNVREMQSLVHYGFPGPAVPNTAGTSQWTEEDPFTGVQSFYYWSSTSDAGNTSNAWYVGLHVGSVFYANKTSSYYVWPVRAGQ